MARPLVAYDGIAIAELIFYLVALAASIPICIKHGFVREAGWRALIILSLARIIGSSLRLGTLSDPQNASLYVGWMTLNNIGLAPLVLLNLGLVARVLSSLHDRIPIRAAHQKFVELLLLVAIILLIVGGTQAGFAIDAAGRLKITYSTLSRVALALLIVVLAVILLQLAIACRYRAHVPRGERRIVLVVAVCMPFVVVRLTYACLLVFGGVTSTAWLYLGLSSLMEMAVALVCIALGLTLARVAKEAAYRPQEQDATF